MSSFSPFSKEELLPQEEMLEIQKRKGELFIGLPKETHLGEKRVCLSPDAVGALSANGHRIVIETGAGDGANFTDKEYSDAGAKISYNVEEAFKCNIVLKIYVIILFLENFKMKYHSSIFAETSSLCFS